MFHFLRQALGTQECQIEPVSDRATLFLTAFIMAPVATQINEARAAGAAGRMSVGDAIEQGAPPLRGSC